MAWLRDDELLDLFKDVDTDENHRYIQSTLERDPPPETKEPSFRNDDLRSLWEWLHPDDEFDATLAKRIGWRSGRILSPPATR